MKNSFLHLFIPQESNNHKPKALHLSSLVLLLLFMGVFQISLTALTRIMPGVLGFATNISPNRVIELTNQRRSEQGLGGLSYSSLLSEAARQKASEMFTFGCWSHECNNKTPWWFFDNVSYDYLYAGENLAKDFADSDGVVAAWMASSTHRDNILNGNYKEIGLAVVNGTLNGEETTIVVQLFGTPSQPPAIAYVETPPETFVEEPVLADQETQAVEEPLLTEEPASLEQTIPVVEKTAEKVAPEKDTEKIVAPELTMKETSLKPLNIYEEKKPVTSAFTLTKVFYGLILALLVIILSLDTFIISQNKIARISGKSFVHASFFIIIFLSVILSISGQIL